MRNFLIVALLLLYTPVLAASDYVREKRWANEVSPAIVVGDPAYLTQGNGHKFLAIYTEAPNARMGVVVAHGMGIHPDWGLIGMLRQRLPDLGYATLSIQMPILAAGAKSEQYATTFPEAVERLELAVRYLKDKGYKRIALVSHSMGTRMTLTYMAGNPADVRAWAALGMSAPKDAPSTYEGVKAPVLDLYGANDLPQVLEGALKRKASLAGNPMSRQTVIADADHFYAGHEDEMIKAVKQFLDDIKQ
jgi:dienelactone hydrolase